MNGYIERKSYRGSTEIAIYSTQVLQPRAELAAHLMEKFGMVAGTPDGEDSSGRAKLRLLTPAEVVERACAVADIAMTQFESRGWILNLPAPKPEPERVETEPSVREVQAG